MKSNKELAVELTIAFINSWNSKSSNTPVSSNDTVNILNNFEATLSKMDTSKE